LSDITEKLAKVKDDPAKFKDELSKYGNGDAAQGVKKLADLLSKTLPGMDGVFDPKLLHGGAAPNGGAGTGTGSNAVAGRSAIAREREIERREIQRTKGSEAVARLIGVDVAAME